MKNRRWMLLCGLLSLSACGFSPIYATGGANGSTVAADLNNVQIASIPDREGQILRNLLIDRMYGQGRPKKPDAVLTISLVSNEADLGIQKDSTATRRSLNMWATYTLKDMNGNELTKGSAHSIVSYNKLSYQYGTLSSQSDAHTRAVHEIGEQVLAGVSLYYAEKNKPAD